MLLIGCEVEPPVWRTSLSWFHRIIPAKGCQKVAAIDHVSATVRGWTNRPAEWGPEGRRRRTGVLAAAFWGNRLFPFGRPTVMDPVPR